MGIWYVRIRQEGSSDCHRAALERVDGGYRIDKSASFPLDKETRLSGRSSPQQGDVILLDEPFTGVDVKTEAKIISLLRELRAEGKTMLVSTISDKSRHFAIIRS